METERLKLREFQSEDWIDVWAWASDPEVTRFMNPSTENEVKAWVIKESEKAAFPGKESFVFAIELKEEKKVVGDCQLHIENSRYSPGQGQLHYCINRAYWNRGIATEAVKEILNFAFCNLSLHRVSCSVVVENLPSIRVLEKTGMRKEARYLQNILIQKLWHDSYLYAMLSSEWKNVLV